MLSFIMAIAIATSSETVDGLKNRGCSSCSSSGCSVAAAPVTEKKVEVPVKHEVVNTSCNSGNCGRHKLFTRRCR